MIPGVSVVKNLPAKTGDAKRRGFDPWVRKIPWRREWQLTPVFLPGESHPWAGWLGWTLLCRLPRLMGCGCGLSLCLLRTLTAGGFRQLLLCGLWRVSASWPLAREVRQERGIRAGCSVRSGCSILCEDGMRF